MARPNQSRVDDALLKQFAEGRLNPEMEVKLACAIEKSPELQARVAEISSDDFLERVKQAAVASRDSRPHSASVKTASQSVAEPHLDAIPQELIESTDYQVLKELGRGGMGVVYAAKYLPMDRMEVLKVLSPQMVAKESARQRFINEMKAIGRLNHPFIATAYQRVVLPTQLVFSMEYVPGRDLHKFIQKHNPIPVPIACMLAGQIATALQHAHSRKMVHRDIKPSNVMVFEEDGKRQIKILDFGLAKATSEQQSEGLTANGTMLGTPEYMAPEQALDAATADIRADIYSLGCTLYHLLAGRPPFTGTYQSVLMAHAQKEAEFVSLKRTDVPIELAEIIAKMMAKEPSKRFQTPKAVVTALKPFLGKAKIRPTRQIAEAKVDTILDLASPSRDTSVESISPPEIAPPNKPDLMTSLENLNVDDRRKRHRAKSTARKSATRAGRRNKPPIAAIIVGGLVAALILFGIVFSMRIQSGTLVIENLPDDARVLVDQENVELRWNEGANSATVRLKKGTRQVEVLTGGVKIAGETVTIASDRDALIAIKRSLTPSSEVVAKQVLNPPSASELSEENDDSLPTQESLLNEGSLMAVDTEVVEETPVLQTQIQNPAALSSSLLVGAVRSDLEQWLDQLDDSVPLSVGVRSGMDEPLFDAVAVQLEKSFQWKASFYDDGNEAGKDFVQMKDTHGLYWKVGIPKAGSKLSVWGGLKLWRTPTPVWWTINYGSKETSSVISSLRKSGSYANSILIVQSDEMTHTSVLTTDRPQLESSPYGVLSLDQLRERIEHYRKQDWYLEYFQLHCGAETPTVSAVFCKTSQRRQWDVSIGIDEQEFWEMRSSRNANGDYPRSLGSYRSNDETRFIVLWHRASESPIF